MINDKSNWRKPLTQKDDHEVGYKKPPKRHRFQRGRSGNSGGRTYGSQNFDKLFAKALDRRVSLNIDGKRTKMRMRDALVLQLVNSALAGSARHVELLLRHDILDAKEPHILWMDEDDATI